jgi:hypothetical protein
MGTGKKGTRTVCGDSGHNTGDTSLANRRGLRSAEISKEGVRTLGDVAQLVAVTLSDFLAGNLTAKEANTILRGVEGICACINLSYKVGISPDGVIPENIKLYKEVESSVCDTDEKG